MPELSKLDFINEELSDWAKGVKKSLIQELNKQKIQTTRALITSLSFQVFKAGTGHQGKYQLSFQEYGRFIDIGIGKGFKIESIKGNAAIIGGKKSRKAKKWYSKTVYRAVYKGLIRRLVTNYRENIKKQARIELKKNK